MQLAEGVHRLGSPFVNFYAVEDAGRITVLDGRLAGYWPQIPELLASMGRSMSDIAAIVQTHCHSDHIGCTERLRAHSGATVFVHEGEGPVLRGDEKPTPPRGLRSVLFDPNALRVLGHIVRNGGARFPTVQRVETYTDGEVLDVPGKPRIVFTPGHSVGHSALLLEQRGVLFAGDAIVTRDLKGRTGPRLMEINADHEGARRSLDRFEGVEATLLLPGHGEPWRGSVSEAVAQARRT